MRRTRALALAAAIPLLAAACGSDDNTSSSSADDTVVTTAAPTTTEEVMSDEEMSDEEMSDEEMSDDMTEEMAPVTFTIRVENVSGGSDVRRTVVFNTPTGAAEPGPLLRGSSYEALVAAAPGERISFATMFVQSNDWFIAPGESGIELYDAEGNPISGDITDQLVVLDGGTEVDQTPGEGADQAPRQAGPDTGDADPDNTVRIVDGRDAAAYLAVDVQPADPGYFTVTITNVSENAATPTPFAPGVVVTHAGQNPLFVIGDADLGAGLEALAEDGNPGPLAESLASIATLPTPIAPVAAVVHHADDGNPIFTGGTATRADGLEGLAEDGGPGGLVDSIGAIAAAVPVGGTDPGPIFPGEYYEFTIEGHAGDRLSLAAMFVQSNDWFFALDGIDLYDGDNPLDGDITDLVTLWDAGTEADQTPGVGSNQAPRQAGPNTGPADDDETVRMIGTGAGTIQVTITAG